MKDLSKFSCPKCPDISLENLGNSLQCKNCNTTYDIINGIPRLVELDNYSESFGFQWNIHAATQLDSHSKLPISEKRLMTATDWKDKDLSGQTILEAGSGAGRFTEVVVKTKADTYSFDYSNAVEANAKNNGHAKNLTLFQGDIFNIPFKDQSFDHVLCIGVIQHTPDPKKAFYSLASKVKPGGSLYIDVYTRSWGHALQWKYLLRPITKNMKKETLYKLITNSVSIFLPPAKFLRNHLGRFGGRLMPITQYDHLGLDPKLNRDWAICDTFDMYSPAHDHPQTMESVKAWFADLGFENIKVWYGDNGVVGRGQRPSN